jgi:putative hemolysin
MLMTAILFLILLGLFMESALFSGAETALFSLNPILIHRIAQRRPRAAREIEAILSHPTRPLSTLLIGNTLVNIAAANVGFILANRLVPGHGAAISIPVMTVLIIIFGELVPKRLAIRHAEALAIRLLPFIRLHMILTTPFRWLLDRLTRSFSKHFEKRHTPISNEDLRTLVDVGEQEGVLNTEESAMIDGIIRLEKIEVRDVMTPRVDVAGLDLEDDPATWTATVRKAVGRFLPAYHGSLDHIDGFIDVPRFLLSGTPDLKAALIPHFFVPDTMPLDNLLTLFQHEHIQLAVVIDEYGGTAGLITRENILEEILPDMSADVTDGGGIKPLGSSRWFVDGTTSLADINDELELSLSSDGADRIAGWVTEKAEHLPRAGEVVIAQGCKATVGDVKRHRVKTVILEKVEEQPL